VIQEILKQKQKLIQKYTDIKHRFVDIYDPSIKTTIPFLPIRIFRDVNVFHGDKADITTFLSSGSTNAIRAQHHFSKQNLDLYSHETCEGFKAFLHAQKLENTEIISLIPNPDEWPTSSLSAMIKMFENHEFHIHWASAAKSIFSVLESLPTKSNLVIFGTTFHHLILLQEVLNNNHSDKFNDLLEQHNLAIIDTGGTKGRTQSFTPKEILKTLKRFYPSQNLRIFSEYGMCELGSQAWSANDKYNGLFKGNKTLLPFAIDLQKRTVLPEHETGYLGFIDSVNKDSYCALITEDIGEVWSYDRRIFKLYGRAPNASIKGCSLHASTLHTTLTSLMKPEKHSSKKSFQSSAQQEDFIKVSVEKVISQLNKRYWSKIDLNDFRHSFQSLDQINLKQNTLQTKLKHPILEHKDILLICAANTPISFVYPLIISGLNSAKSFTLKIPSLRINDFLSTRIRQQITDLFRQLSLFFPKTMFNIQTSGALSTQLDAMDCLMVFGTDETIKLLHDQCPKHVNFWGFGDIKNSMVFDRKIQTVYKIADLCTVWNGRGCLTPVCLFVDDNWKKNDTDLFFKSLTISMDKRFYGFENVLLHDHARLFVESQIKKMKEEFSKLGKSLDSSVSYSAYTTVVDMSKCDWNTLQKMNIDFTLAGSGFIYLISKKNQNKFQNLYHKSISPSIFDFSTTL